MDQTAHHRQQPAHCRKSQRREAVRTSIAERSNLLFEIEQIVCQSKNRLASACAIPRAYPLYSAKTDEKAKERTVYVTFLYTDVPSALATPTEDDVKCFKSLANSIRLTSKIIDMPCADMTTDDFLSVRFPSSTNLLLLDWKMSST